MGVTVASMGAAMGGGLAVAAVTLVIWRVAAWYRDGKKAKREVS